MIVCRTLVILVLLLTINACQCGQAKKKIDCPVISIDFGSTSTCVAVKKNGVVEIIANQQGNRNTPSVISFTEEGELIGEHAKYQAIINPTRTLYDIKRLLGRKYTTLTLHEVRKQLHYNISLRNSKPLIRVENTLGESKLFTPEEITSMFLAQMKKNVETYLNENIKNAIITVPALFSDEQRQSIKEAGKMAGLDILRIINEPTAAAIAYGIDQRRDEQNVLVFHLGGRTCEVSVLIADEGIFEVLSNNYNDHFGGVDFDQRIMEYFIKLIKEKRDIDVSNDRNALQKLSIQVEKAKRILSSSQKASIEIENLIAGFDFIGTLARDQFEELNGDLFNKIIGQIQSILEESGLEKKQIHEIILVGGSTRIPKIRNMIQEFFNKEPLMYINPEEAVAYGGAVQGSILCGEYLQQATLCSLYDINYLSFGIETGLGLMTPLIPRNTIYPTKVSQTFTAYLDQNGMVTIKIFEGDRIYAKDNSFLGQLTLSGIPNTLKGEIQIEVSFELDYKSILQVIVVEQNSGVKNKFTFDYQNQIDRSYEDIEKIMNDLQAFKDYDDTIKKRVETNRQINENYFLFRNNSIIL